MRRWDYMEPRDVLRAPSVYEIMFPAAYEPASSYSVYGRRGPALSRVNALRVGRSLILEEETVTVPPVTRSGSRFYSKRTVAGFVIVDWVCSLEGFFYF